MNLVLKKFMIFDPSQGKDEGHEREKLLYHWTKDSGSNGKVDIKEQIDDICLCDASMGVSTRLGLGLSSSPVNERDLFTASQCSSQLDPSEPMLSVTGRHLNLTFDSTVIVIVEVEPIASVWMAAHVAKVQPPENSDPVAQASSSPTDQENIPTTAIKQIIENIYLRFCLINGTFQMLKEQIAGAESDQSSGDDGSIVREKLLAICDTYFDTVLPEIHLNSILSNVASLYNHISYLRLDPLTLMRVTSFTNHLVCINPRQIRHTIAIFNDQLLYSSLNAHDSRLVYNYMVGVLIRAALQEELSRETEVVRRIKENMPIYLKEPADASKQQGQILTDGDDQPPMLSKFYLTVFRSSNYMTLGLILSECDRFDLLQKCEQILTSDSRLGVIPLASLAKSIGQSFLKASTLATASAASQSNQLIASTSVAAPGRRRQSTSSSSLLNSSIPVDQKYICLDRLDFSISSSFSMEATTRNQHPAVDGYSNETTASGRKMRLVKYMIDLEPEMQDIEKLTGRRVEEYLVKTFGDTWLTLVNSKYRCIYSVYKMRNAGLVEAQQAAHYLKAALLSNRP